MRSLWFNYPADFNGYAPPLGADEFLVGDDLLVAPVMQQGATARGVYFPKGDVWIDWWTGERHEGGTGAEVSAPLNRLPLFIRAGAAIATQPVVQHTGEMARAPLMLAVAVGAGAQSRIYEDAGEGYDYKRGAWRQTTVTQDANTLRFTRTGTFAAARTLAAVDFIGITAKPRSVLLDGREVKDISFDRDAHRLHVPLPTQTVNEIVLVP
jgi:alpha-glucosidase